MAIKPKRETVLRARALRKEMTPAEQKMWRLLRDRRLAGFKFRRQHAIGPFIADFCCLPARLIVELDGGGHVERADYDAERTRWLNEQGFEVIRFTNPEVMKECDAVVEVIWQACVQRTR